MSTTALAASARAVAVCARGEITSQRIDRFGAERHVERSAEQVDPAAGERRQVPGERPNFDRP
jgi:hypothetical protein